MALVVMFSQVIDSVITLVDGTQVKMPRRVLYELQEMIMVWSVIWSR